MSPIFLDRFEKSNDAILVDVLVAFCSTAQMDVRALADAVEREIETALVPDELIVLVRAASVEATISTLNMTTPGQALMGRLQGRSNVVVLGYDAGGCETSRTKISPGQLTSDIGLDEITRRGVTSIFQHRRGFVRASASYHFANPSGAHTDRFMRLSNILVRQAEIAFIAVAVMRRLPMDAVQAYIDTPALYAVVSAINDQWTTLDPGRPAIVADNFSSYFGFDEHVFTSASRSIALISASSSGRLGTKLVDRKGFDPARIVHVLYLGPKEPSPLPAANLGHDAIANPGGFSNTRRTFEAEDCELCREDSVPITLKGDQFDIAGPQHPPLMIKRTDAPKSLGETMARLAGTGALRVSAGARMFDIDAAELFASETFLARLNYLVRRQVPARVEAVVLIDAAAQTILDSAKAIIGEMPVPTERAAVPSLSDNRGTPLLGAVVVIASVIGSGRLLLDVSRDLRNAARDAPIIYLVGFAKIQDPERRQSFDRSLIQTPRPPAHIVEYVDELLLPGNQPLNPWQEELAFLERNRRAWSAAATPILAARLQKLRETSAPLIDDVFLPDHSGRPLKLREGFVFWPSTLTKSEKHTQADVFYTIASVLQQLRTAKRTAGAQAIRTNWMQQTIVSPENFGRYNDGIIQASILRAARPSELDYRDDASASADAGRIIRRILENASRPRGEAAAEFLVALGTGALRLCPSDHDVVLAKLPDAPALVRAFMDMCRAEREASHRGDQRSRRPKRRAAQPS